MPTIELLNCKISKGATRITCRFRAEVDGKEYRTVANLNRIPGMFCGCHGMPSFTPALAAEILAQDSWIPDGTGSFLRPTPELKEQIRISIERLLAPQWVQDKIKAHSEKMNHIHEMQRFKARLKSFGETVVTLLQDGCEPKDLMEVVYAAAAKVAKTR